MLLYIGFIGVAKRKEKALSQKQIALPCSVIEPKVGLEMVFTPFRDRLLCTKNWGWGIGGSAF